MSLWHSKRPWTRTFSRGHGRYEHRPALCSRCKVLPAPWMTDCRYTRRYYCDECVTVTKAWKEKQAAEVAGGES